MQGYVYNTFNNATDAHIISSSRLLTNVFAMAQILMFRYKLS